MLFRFLVAAIVFSVVASPGAAGQSARSAAGDTRQDAAAAFEEGQSAQERGDLKNAVRLYTEAIAADPNLYQAYYQRATALMRLNNIREAETDLKKVIQFEPTFARAHRALGQILLDRDQVKEAIGELGRAIELDPKMTGVRIYYASALIKTGQPRLAIDHLRVAIAQEEELPLAHALLGVALERTENAAEAFEEYNRAIRLDATNATAREGRARALEARGDLTGAIEDYSAAYRAQPSREVALTLARLHARAGQPQAAVGVYRMLLQEKSDDLSIRVDLAKLLADMGQSEEAVKEIGVVLKAKPADPNYQVAAGDIVFKEKPDVAAGYYRRAIELDPRNNRARVQLGASLVRSMNYEEALGVLTDALIRQEGNYAAHANLATALFKLRRYPEAGREFLWIIRAKPEVQASYFFLAICLDKIGDCEQSLKAYTEFVRRADQHQNANEIEEANRRIGELGRLIKEKKCAVAKKGK
jgi:tetratricopeptide (TPR) repeat protein